MQTVSLPELLNVGFLMLLLTVRQPLVQKQAELDCIRLSKFLWLIAIFLARLIVLNRR